jgi:hypothetical protein
MAKYLQQSGLHSDLSAVNELLRSLPEEDALGRISLESRRDALASELSQLGDGQDTLASTALYFGGRPVIGSAGIEAEFAATAISGFKNLIVNVWATKDSEVASRGPVPDQDSARLHITALLHGSMGFLIEEIDPKAVPLFPSSLKRAADDASDLIRKIASESEEVFQEQLDLLHPRVFASVQRFFKELYRAEANIRIVDAVADTAMNRESVDRAFVRLEEAKIDERTIEEDGVLQGLIPNGARFEFRSEAGVYREGKVAPTLSEAYLQRLENEQYQSKWFKAKMIEKEVSRFGKTKKSYTLTDLQAIERGIS